MKSNHNLSQYLAEFIGTFFLVFFGCGSVISSQVNPSFDGSLIPLAFGGTVMIMIYATGHLSGAHFNPAVTLAFWVIGRFPKERILGYLTAQFMGAIIASSFHFLLWGKGHSFGVTLSQTVISGFLMEVLLSFVLMFVIVAVATDARAVGELAGIAIGATVALCALIGGPITGASMNPARTLAPALFQGDYSQLWLYFLAPMIGAALGAKVYDWIRCQKEETENSHGCC